MASPCKTSEEHEPPYVDIFNCTVLNDELKVTLLKSDWPDVHKYAFKSRWSGDKARKAQMSWFTTYNWLRYSVKENGLFCAPCSLFVGSDPRGKVLVKSPLTDFSNAPRILRDHNKHLNHEGAAMAANNFIAIQSGESKSIESVLDTKYNEMVERNRGVLVRIVDAIVFCGKQNLPLRGHRDEEGKGNFIALLHHQAKTDALLKTHLDNGDPNTKYISPTIQNELIDLCGKFIRDKLVERCNSSGMFSLIADEATDAATMEQMSLCVRYVCNDEVQEDFLGFAECSSTTGEYLANAFLENLVRIGVQTAQMVGQGYDGAGNMSGKRKGVQARIQQQIPNAVYTHCKAHCLNLAIVHACSETFVKNMMGTVQTVAFAFNYSAKRLLKYQDTLETDPQSTEAMGNRSKLVNLCDTRWTARAKALDTFLCSYSTVVSALEFLADDGDAKAAAYLLSVSTFEFVITLVTTEHCIKSLVQLSENLQEKTCDLLKASQEAKTQKVMLQNERNDITVWEALYDKAVNIARTVGVEPSMPRSNGRQRNRPNVPADTPSEFWRLNMYLPFTDHLITDLSDRLLQANERYLAQNLIPSQIQKEAINTTNIVRLYEAYRGCLGGTDEATFSREVRKWVTWWTEGALALDRPQAPETLLGTLPLANEQYYPNVRRCLLVLLTMPVSTATAERSFSTMKRLKTYLRSTMTTERLSGLGLMNIYRDMKINSEYIVDKFAARKQRRLAFVFRE